MALRLKVFADEKVGKDGLLYKAGMSNEDDDIEGWGIGYDSNTWMSESVGTTVDSVNGGLKVADADEASSSYYFNLDIPAANRTAMASRGFIQFDMYITDLTTKTLVNKWLMQSGRVATYALGIVDKFDVKPLLAGYPTITKDYNDVDVVENPVSITSSSSLLDNTKHAQPVVILHDGLANSEGYITYSKSWTNRFIDTYINGVLVNRMYRLDGIVDQIIDMTLWKFQLNVAVTMRNLLLYDRPAADPTINGLRIANFGHSYMARDNLAVQDSIGTPGQNRGYAAVELIGSQLYKRINENIDYRCFGVSGDTMSQIYDRINDADMTYTLPGAGTYKNSATRGRPHFCIVCGYSNGKGTFATITEGVNTIAALLISRGVIPIFSTEHNRHLVSDQTASYTEYLAAIEAYKVTHDMGLADVWTASGGTTGDDTWVESGDAANHHPNIKALAVYGEYISDEINRLINSPPGYSILAQGK